MQDIFEIASQLSTPLALGGFFAAVLFSIFGYPRKAGQFKIKPFVVILSATHFSHYKILELDLTGL